MHPDAILGLLGQSADTPDVKDLLRLCEIRRSPGLPEPENRDEESAWYDWLPNSAKGIELGFTDKAFALALDPDSRGTSEVLLTQIYFYGDHEGVEAYRDSLPLGLSLEDNRASLRHKLAAFETSRRSYIRDVWNIGTCNLIVAYTPEGRISSLLFAVPLASWPTRIQPVTTMPTPDTIINLFGQAWYSPPFRQLFEPFGLTSCGRDIALHRYADMRSDYGFELYFSRKSGINQTAPSAKKGFAFAAIKYYRDRDQDAQGWKGPLPFQLSFEDGQEMAFKKIGCHPNEHQDTDYSGYALWHFPDYSLHIEYSNLENLLYRITLMRPGFWEAPCA